MSLFVVFEGIDGSGKTTLSNKVAERLRARGLSVKHLRAGGQYVSTVTEAIRSLGRDARNLDLVPQAEFLLYVAREVQLIEEALKPALRDHDIVLADRFLFTAEVLANHGRSLSPAWTAPVLIAAAGGIAPDLVVLMDVEPTLARARRKAHKRAVGDARPPSRRGLSGVGLQHRLRQGYLALAQNRPESWLVVDNDQTLEAAAVRVSELIERGSNEGAAAALTWFQRRPSAAPKPATAAASKPKNAAQALAAFLHWVTLRAENEPRVAAYMLSGLAGEGVDPLRRALMERVPDAVLAGLNGLTDDVSWECRERGKASHPGHAVRTLGAYPNHDPRARALRLELEPVAKREVLTSLAGLDDEAAWELRERGYADEPSAVLQSLARIASERGWALRGRWLEQHENALASDYEIARVASRSVHALDDERAFRVREAARSAAPVAALNSLTGVSCERSWQWRERYLARAPKPVMSSLRGSEDPRAFALRARVAAECKEAIDSIAGLDSEAAWALRESYADVWPSTVVKSLVPLADGARAKRLLERQLASHGANVSLLKHAAAVALGLRTADEADD